MKQKRRILTGDRPTGPLHLGHYIGSLSNRVQLQQTHEQYVMIADVQALTDNFDSPQKIRDNIIEVALDYLAVGLDPTHTTICIQSLIPEIAELTIFYLNFVTVNRLQRNPTVKAEMKQKGYEKNVTAGFLMYPIHQVADITVMKGELVPVGADQLPMIEQANEIIRAFNRTYQTNALVEVEALIPQAGRLPGIDGKEKMSKSLGNAIFLSDGPDQVAQKVKAMYTDSRHIRVEDPGTVEGNTVFMYLDIFGTDTRYIAALKEHYQRGGLGDMTVKKYLIDVLNNFLEPIQIRRKEFASDTSIVMDILLKGSERARTVARKTMQEVRSAMKLNYE